MKVRENERLEWRENEKNEKMGENGRKRQGLPSSPLLLLSSPLPSSLLFSPGGVGRVEDLFLLLTQGEIVTCLLHPLVVFLFS